MIKYTCPHCGMALEAPESLAGQDHECPACHERTIVPRPRVRVSAEPVPPFAPPRPGPPGIITTPLLISAICNCVAAAFWLCTCFGVIITAGLVVLLIFEFLLYSDLHSPSRLVNPSKVKTIAICEIVAGLVSLAPLVCGIIILSNLGKVDINAWKRPGP